MAKKDDDVESALCGIGCVLIVIVGIVTAIVRFVQNHPVITALIVVAVLAVIIIGIVEHNKRSVEAANSRAATTQATVDPDGTPRPQATQHAPGYGLPLTSEVPPDTVREGASGRPGAPAGPQPTVVPPITNGQVAARSIPTVPPGKREEHTRRSDAFGHREGIRQNHRPMRPTAHPVPAPARRPNPWEQMAEKDLRMLVAGLLVADGWQVDHDRAKTWREFVAEDSETGKKLVVKCVASALTDDETFVGPERIQAVTWRDPESERLLVISGRSPGSAGRRDDQAEPALHIVDSDDLTRWNDGEAQFRSGTGLVAI